MPAIEGERVIIVRVLNWSAESGIRSAGVIFNLGSVEPIPPVSLEDEIVSRETEDGPVQIGTFHRLSYSLRNNSLYQFKFYTTWHDQPTLLENGFFRADRDVTPKKIWAHKYGDWGSYICGRVYVLSPLRFQRYIDNGQSFYKPTPPRLTLLPD